MAPTLLVKDLKTYFFTRHAIIRAVDGVSFNLERGETLGLVGESGCGKSVTALSMLRLVPQPGKIVGGQIILDGEDLLTKSDAEMRKIRGKRIAIILQDPMTSLNPAFSVGFQIGETIRLHQGARGKTLSDRVKEALEMVNITSADIRMWDYPHQMSGGMRQRVVGSIALSCRPEVLIADEPTTSLDVTIQAQYLDLLKEVRQTTNISMVFITHDFGVVAQICDSVGVMYAGRIVEYSSTKQLFENPLHPYTSALLDCMPRLEGGDQVLANIVGQPPSLSSLPVGCHFAPRCHRCQSACQQAYPPEVEVEPGHRVTCWLAMNRDGL